MLEGLTPLHLILVLGIVLLVVGPRRLPELGSALGKTLREFRDATTGLTEAPPTAVPPAAPAVPPAAPAVPPATPTLPAATPAVPPAAPEVPVAASTAANEPAVPTAAPSAVEGDPAA